MKMIITELWNGKVKGMICRTMVLIFLLSASHSYAQTEDPQPEKDDSTKQEVVDSLKKELKKKKDTAEEENSEEANETDSKKTVKKSPDKNKDEVQTNETIPADTSKPKYPPAVVFGQEFFRNGNLKFFQKSNDTKAPDNYLIGTGDELTIQVYGYSDFKGTFRVDEDGAIYQRDFGKIYVKDLTFIDAKRLIKQRLGLVFNTENSGVEITLSYSRTIMVHIVGEVFTPGSYVIPAINSAINALVAIGGPSDVGSVRNIFLKRGGKIIDTIDVYQFLLDPQKSREIFLQNNDYIIVSPATRVIRIEGAVRKPNAYELKSNEGLMSLIKWAGGLSPTAYTKSILIKRLQENEQGIAIDLNLDSLIKANKDFKLKDGDNINIRSNNSSILDYVSIGGAVNVPGDYQFTKGDKVADLIKRANGLSPFAYPEKAYLIRTNANLTFTYVAINISSALKNPSGADNILLEKKDNIYIFSQQEFLDPFNVTINTGVRKPGSFPISANLRLRDLILMSGGLKEDTYPGKAYIFRTNEDLSQTTIGVALNKAMNDENSSDNILLQKKDIVTLFSYNDFLETYTINITGAVKKPGQFPYSKDLKLSDLIFQAGGLKAEAQNGRLDVARIMTLSTTTGVLTPIKIQIDTFTITGDLLLNTDAEKFTLMPMDEIYVRPSRDFQPSRHVTIMGEVKFPGVYAIGKQTEKVTSLVSRAGGFTELAFETGSNLTRTAEGWGDIYFNMKKALKRPNSHFNYHLMDGDIIVVPPVIDFIKISGAFIKEKKPNMINKDTSVSYKYATDNLISVPYAFGKKAKYYVKNYTGGYSKVAKKKNTIVVRPDGRIKKTRSFVGIKFYPRVPLGAEVVVKPNERKVRQKQERERRFKIDTGGKSINASTFDEWYMKTMDKITGILSIVLLARTAVK